MSKPLIVLLLSLVPLGCSKESSAYRKPTDTTKPPATTPAEPGNGSSDIALADKVRSALQADATLPASAKTITVTAKGGVVTLSGTVKDEAEKNAIAAKATAIAGATNVVNQLTIQG